MAKIPQGSGGICSFVTKRTTRLFGRAQRPPLYNSAKLRFLNSFFQKEKTLLNNLVGFGKIETSLNKGMVLCRESVQ